MTQCQILGKTSQSEPLCTAASNTAIKKVLVQISGSAVWHAVWLNLELMSLEAKTEKEIPFF